MGAFETIGDFLTAHPTGTAGEAFLVEGELYVAGPDGEWISTGIVEGPIGPTGPQGTQENYSRRTALPTRKSAATNDFSIANAHSKAHAGRPSAAAMLCTIGMREGLYMIRLIALNSPCCKSQF
jgi:hypothetical protein